MIFVCFICLLSVLQTMETTATTQKQNRLDSTMSSCNINNYNSFYAGHNKKLENTIIEMKRKLDAIEQELKNLTKKVEPTKIVPDPVAFFPLNAAYGTKEINNRAVKGILGAVTLAPGPDGRPNYSYQFSGSSNSYIEFPNRIGGPLDVRFSMTMLCWVYFDGQDGPLFNYRTSGSWGVHLWVVNGKLFVRFTKRGYSFTTNLIHTSLAGGWKFVGASYDRCSGEAKLWVNGAVVQTLNIGAGLELATQDSIRMGVKSGDRRYFKGRIAQMRIYNRALSQEQIQAIQKLVAA